MTRGDWRRFGAGVLALVLVVAGVTAWAFVITVPAPLGVLLAMGCVAWALLHERHVAARVVVGAASIGAAVATVVSWVAWWRGFEYVDTPQENPPHLEVLLVGGALVATALLVVALVVVAVTPSSTHRPPVAPTA